MLWFSLWFCVRWKLTLLDTVYLNKSHKDKKITKDPDRMSFLRMQITSVNIEINVLV